ncbi:protein translocase subunit SecD [Aliifodinibius sp. S!AR15-10]|uniref:protein translocase subunit SecD n=1 Tax=Aliifodinibius sp. S!AR15-10 TaxID=2950437 RepID=UPI002862ADE1|nr:protein translocase subunit SecD [Aliifodinibius sp. S!AR15-10]MDR8391259.1 protein translocase subunit SecD [Aliifodinibius sp. S!AR15-10]
MKDNGFKIGCIVAFLAMSIYYLWPTVAYWLEQNYIEDLPQAERTEYVEENNARLQGLRSEMLSLGLDLQGGMHVTLEVGTPQLVYELAGQYADTTLENVIDVADQRALQNGTDFINELVQEFEQRDSNARLSRYYRSDADNITRRSTNEEIQQYLQTQRDEAVDRAIEIIRTRVDRYGVNEPSILKQGNNRVVVELPGVANKERVRSLLKGTARLEFRLAADPNDLNSARKQIISYYDQQAANDTSDTTTAMPASQTDAPNPLSQVLNPSPRNQYVFGYASASDTARVNELLGRPEVQNMIPRNIELMWGATPFQTSQDGAVELFELIGVRESVEMTGEVIEEAQVTFNNTTNAPEVSMAMNSEGARQWARITGANIGKPIAIVLDGYVYSYPNVNTKIANGRSVIEGIGQVTEAEDLVNILLSGALPAPLDIVEERTVGATLGESSIKSGFYSTFIGLVIVAIFMIVYYHRGGAIADLALLLNIVFILGILAAFNATLTLPGIAGIVLTIGMAVDANVLIFDRIREEQRTGKTLRAAIDSGYANAMSAIVDANVTTFFVGIILFSFGVGPIKGFAVTLMAGIVASLFSAIVITRVVVDWLTRDRSAEISFG